jgi:type I restriction enzyme S subunit
MSRANTTELVVSAAIAPPDVRPRLLLSDKLYRLEVKADELIPEFLVYFLRTPSGRFDFERTASGASNSMQNISQEVVRNIWLPVPPINEQHDIVARLACETARLDALLSGKQRLLELLAEKRKAIIATAVTRGLDPKVKVRDSGVPWLGEIPAHWEVTRLKFHLNGITQGWSPQCEALPAGPGDWGVLKAGCVNGETFNAEENKRLPDHEIPVPEIEVHPRDVVMSRANTTALVGSAAIVPADIPQRLLLSDKLYRLEVKTDELMPEFLVYFLRTPSGRFDFERTASGASNSMQNISQDVVQNLWLPVPPVNEQHAIVKHIARETAELDAVRAAIERTIELLKERRAALITAAVTGQLEARAAA